MKDRIFLSGLNGIRAIAALAVVFSHITLSLPEFGLSQFIIGKYDDGSPRTTLLAGFGVTIFFTLSGFLITYLLLEEKKSAGEINVRNFYMRRILRIWPLYYLYLILSLLTMYTFDIPIDPTVPFFVFLLANVPFIAGRIVPLLTHYWSLGVEEQFYSFWPWIVRKSKSILKTAIVICVVLIALKTIVRLVDIKLNNGNTSVLYDTLHVTRFHCMLIGAIGAILYFQKHTLFLQLTNNFVTQFSVWVIMVLLAINKFHLISFLDNEIIAVVSVALIIGQIEKRKRLINLNLSFFDFIGKISYGIYVIHPLVIFYLSKILVPSDEKSIVDYLLVFTATTSITIGVSYLSFRYFENYFLNMKDKYSTVKSSGTMRRTS